MDATNIYIIFPRKDINTNSTGRNRVWGDHYTFLKNDNNNINFHRTIVEPLSNNTFIGSNNHKYCIIHDNTIIPFINNKYDIENIKCLNYNPLIPVTNPIEIEIIRFIITYP